MKKGKPEQIIAIVRNYRYTARMIHPMVELGPSSRPFFLIEDSPGLQVGDVIVLERTNTKAAWSGSWLWKVVTDDEEQT